MNLSLNARPLGTRTPPFPSPRPSPQGEGESFSSPPQIRSSSFFRERDYASPSLANALLFWGASKPNQRASATCSNR